MLKPGPSLSQTATKADQEAVINPDIDTLFQRLARHDKAYGAVAVMKNGELIHNQAYGYSRLKDETQKAATPTTEYHIGSITKTFTATLIMQLVEEGALSLDTRLAEFYPEIPNADAITIEHLLRHRSGLYNLTIDTAWRARQSQYLSHEEMLERFRAYEPQFEPDSQFQYSNTNYVLLGYIVEDLTNQSYARALEERIAKPLSLDHTHFPKATLRPGQAASYRWGTDGWDTLEPTAHRVTHGAGALLSTPTDLLRFYRGLCLGELVDTATFNQMTDMGGGFSQRNSYGLGLLQMPFGKRIGYGHTGGIDGYRASASYFPDDSLGIAITTNALNYELNQIAIDVLTATFKPSAFSPPEFDQKDLSLSPERLQRMTGYYTSETLPLDITLRLEDEQLEAQATNQSAFPLTPTSDTSFKYVPAGVKMQFKRSESDQLNQFYLLQGGGKFLFERKEEQKN